MKSMVRYFGMLGLVILAFGIVATIIDLSQLGTFSLFSKIHLISGAVLLVTWMVLHTAAVKDLFLSRSTRHGAGTAVYVGLFAVIVVSINVITVTNPTLVRKWDFTEEQVYSLSDQTVKILRGLTEDVTVTAFFAVGANARELFAEMLARERNHAGNLRVELVDADEDPQKAKEYEATNGVVVVHRGANRTKISELAEQELTNALIQVTTTENKVVSFLKGHDEGDLDDDKATGYLYLKKYVENEGYQLDELFLNKVESVPQKVKVLVVLAPTTRFLEEEVRKVELFLAEGGHLFVVLGAEFNQDRSALVDVGLNPLFEPWGFRLREDIVFFEQPMPAALRQLFGRQVAAQVVLDEFETHPIVEGFKARLKLPYARSLERLPQTGGGTTLTDLLVAKGEEYWGETDVAGVLNSSLEKGATDHQPPLTVGLVASKPVGEAYKENKRHDQGVMVVIGSSGWLQNKAIPDSNSPDFFLNTLNWLAGESAKISVRPRQIRASKLSWTPEEANIIFYASVLTLPELILIFGLAIWQWRRRR